MADRTTTISFFGTVDADSKKTLVSKRIAVPFGVRRISASFIAGTNRTMKLYFFVSPDPSAPTTTKPTGTNVLTQHGHRRYITGDDERKELFVEVEFKERGYYLKVYADNEDNFPHTIDAQMMIRLREPK